jgi:hypothetical protein
MFEKYEASSPTVKTELVILNSVIDVSEEQVIGVYNIPGAFLHSKLDEVVHMKVTGVLATFLVMTAPEISRDFVVYEKGISVIYLQLTCALRGCLKSALQFWKHLSGNLKQQGYILNPYDTCVVNKEINGEQMTIVWHVDDLKLSHNTRMDGPEELYTSMTRDSQRWQSILAASGGKLASDKSTFYAIDWEFTTGGKPVMRDLHIKSDQLQCDSLSAKRISVSNYHKSLGHLISPKDPG